MTAAARALRAPFARVPELPGAAFLLALLAAGFALASPEFLSPPTSPTSRCSRRR